MKVSIIIPTLNEAAIISESLQRAWALGPHEVIVVDGGSQDDTVPLARKSASRVVQTRRGRAFQQNAGAQAAAGDALLFLHADNWLPPAAMEQILDALRDRRVKVGAFWQQVESPGLAFRLLERGNAYRVARWGLAYGDQGIFIRRVVFEACGGFPDVALMEDLYLLKRLKRETWPVLLPGPLYVSPRRWRRNGVLRQTALNWLLLTAARLGVAPDRLAAYYVPHCESAVGRSS